MPWARKLASTLLELAIRHSPPEGQDWGLAMLREMDFVEGDKEVLYWAMGSTGVLCRYSMRLQWRNAWAQVYSTRTRAVGKKMVEGTIEGLGIGGVLLGFCLLAYIASLRLEQLRLFSPQLADRMFIFVLPELAYVIAICRLWKNQRPVAFGVLLAAVILFTHVLVHHANHVGRRADAVRDDAWTLSDKSKGLRQTRAGSI